MRPRSRTFTLIQVMVFAVILLAFALARGNSGQTTAVNIVFGVVVVAFFVTELVIVYRRKWTGGFSTKRARQVETRPKSTSATATVAPTTYHAPAAAPAQERARIVPPSASTPGLTWGGLPTSHTETPPTSE